MSLSITFKIQDFTSVPVKKGSTLNLIPISSSIGTNGEYLVIDDAISKKVTTTDGTIVFNDVYPNYYACEFLQSYHKNIFYISASGVGELNAKDLRVDLVPTASMPVFTTASVTSVNNECDVNFYFQDFTSQPITCEDFNLTPISRSIIGHNDYLVTTDRLVKKTNSVGSVSYTGVTSGLYSAKIGNDSFTIYVPDVSASYNGKDLIVNASGSGYNIISPISASHALTSNSSISASYAYSASHAISASYAPSIIPDLVNSASHALTSDYAVSSSYAPFTVPKLIESASCIISTATITSTNLIGAVSPSISYLDGGMNYYNYYRTANASFHYLRIYTYNVLSDGSKVFSNNYVETSLVSQDTYNPLTNYYVAYEWDTTGFTCDGFRILKYSTYDNYNYDYYKDISLTDFNNAGQIFYDNVETQWAVGNTVLPLSGIDNIIVLSTNGSNIVNTTASLSISASHSDNSISASYAFSASYAPTIIPDLVNSSSHALVSDNSISASHSLMSNSASYATYTLTNEVTKEPTGFPDRTSSNISYDNGTKLFSITGSNFKIYAKGREYTKSNDTVLIPTTKGQLNYVYYDCSDLVLKTTEIPWVFDNSKVFVATVYIGELGNGFISDERHGIQMDAVTHEYLHETVGARYAFGFNGTFGTGGTLAITAGEFYDEDIEHQTYSTLSQSRMAYYSHSMIVSTTLSSSFWNGGPPKYNNVSTGATSSLVTNQRAAYWIYATNGTVTPFASIMGQRVDTTLNNAIANNKPEDLIFGQFPYAEAKLLYRVIVGAAGDIQNTVDYRTSQYAGSTFVPTDHGSLSGLTDDDHPQYALLTGRAGDIYNGTSSMALTASIMDPAYTTVTTSSTNWITCSFGQPEQYVNITTGLLYNFTCSNLPATNNYSDINLYLNNTATTTSSLAFPATWKNLEGAWPTSITASKSALVSLRAYGQSTIIGTVAIEL